MERVLATCGACKQINASFNAQPSELQPLPIRGMFYRWGCDLCGPFPTSESGNTFCMVMVEHFSKHIEVAAIPTKTSENTAKALLAHVITRFGACAEVLTDNGTEFRGEFQQLLEDCFIDHRTTSPQHPQADGLAERAVQTIKHALIKHVKTSAKPKEWDQYLQWVVLGYRCSKQASTKLSPYEMLYGVAPVIPPAVHEGFSEPIDMDDPELAAQHVKQRASLLQRHCCFAMGNLQIAQQRDTERYRRVRSGDYLPRTVKFEVGDYVYRRRPIVSGILEPDARPGICRVLAVRPSGVLHLQGQCGNTLDEHISNCAPCHLSNIDPAIDRTLQHVTADFPCHVCGSTDDEDIMLLCDWCGLGYHIFCLSPALPSIPEDLWLCPTCVGKGVNSAQVRERWEEHEKNQPLPEPIIPSAKQLAFDEAAKKLNGRVVKKAIQRSNGTVDHIYGRITYRGRFTKYPRHFRADFVDGSSQLITARTARRWLQSEDTELPGFTLVTEGQALTELPDTWDLTIPQVLGEAMQALTNVHMRSDEQHAQALAISKHIQKSMSIQALGVPSLPPFALHDLLQTIELSTCVRVLELWGCSASLSTALQVAGYPNMQLATNFPVIPINMRTSIQQPVLAADPLQPASYRQWTLAAPVEVGIVMPPPELADVALSICMAFCTIATFMLVPSSYLSNVTYFRSAWMQSLRNAGVLVTVPCSQTGQALTWVLVFRTRAARGRMIYAR